MTSLYQILIFLYNQEIVHRVGSRHPRRPLAAFEFAYLSTVEQKIGEFIFNEYLDIDSVFRAYLSDLDVNVEEVKKAILDSDDPLYELYEHYKNIFNYFDDWIVVD